MKFSLCKFCFAAAFVMVVAVAVSAPVLAQAAKALGSFDAWEAYQETDGGQPVCYVGSQPTTAKGKYKTRGETYILITHRPAEKSLGVVSLKAGYTFQKASEADIIIGEATFKLFTDDGHAFAYDQKTDKAIVSAMIRGARLEVKGTSSRGTKTTDTYSLKGFSAAYKAIGKACKVK
ncbi:MAG: invasion associated locus B family protein [Proteobacteria bacterium]|nr:invasion associated locus B family protein [Pseudomonadota bacterium]